MPNLLINSDRCPWAAHHGGSVPCETPALPGIHPESGVRKSSQPAVPENGFELPVNEVEISERGMCKLSDPDIRRSNDASFFIDNVVVACRACSVVPNEVMMVGHVCGLDTLRSHDFPISSISGKLKEC